MIFYANWLPADDRSYLLSFKKQQKFENYVCENCFLSGPLWVKRWLFVITVVDDSVMWRHASSIPACPPVSWYFLKIILGPTTGILSIDSAAFGLKTVDESMACQLLACWVIFHDCFVLCRYFLTFFSSVFFQE